MSAKPALPAKAAKRKKKQSKPSKKPKPTSSDVDSWDLILYVAGNTPKAILALQNLKSICELHLDCRYRIQVIDLLRHPHLAKDDQVFAVPTLVKKLPQPVRKIIGDLSNTEKVLVGLNLRLSGE